MALLRKNEYKKDEDALNRAEAEQANALYYWNLRMNKAAGKNISLPFFVCICTNNLSTNHPVYKVRGVV